MGNFKEFIKKATSYKLQVIRSTGFTLIETIIYMGLLAMILLVITNLLISASYFSQEEAARLAIQKNGRYAIEKIIRDVQSTNLIEFPIDSSPVNSLDLGDITYQINGDRLMRTNLVSGEFVTDNQVKINLVRFSRIGNVGGKPTLKIELTVDYIGRVEGNRNISQNFVTTYSLK